MWNGTNNRSRGSSSELSSSSSSSCNSSLNGQLLIQGSNDRLTLLS